MARKALTFVCSRSFLLSGPFLQILFWVNALGTLYGYEWYRAQLIDTWTNYSPWLVLFVPDSPTASLFFTITLVYLMRDVRRGARMDEQLAFTPERTLSLRGIWEALAVITQVKYGIWATVIIFWGASQGDPIHWTEWMLIFSHTGMALEALLYMRFYRFTAVCVLVGAAWTLTNDVIDYTFGVFPYLPAPLYDDIASVQVFTSFLSFVGIICAFVGVVLSRKNRV